MKTKKNAYKNKSPLVSQIVQTIDQYGRDVLGFTVQYNEASFYNIIRPFNEENYTQVYKSLTEEREKIINGKLKEKKK